MASNASCGWGGVGGAWTGTECVCASGWRNDRHLFLIDNCSVHLGVDVTYAVVLGLLGLRLLASSAWAWNHSERIKVNPEYAGLAMSCGVYGLFLVVEPCALFTGETTEGFVIHTVSWMMKEVVVGFMMLLVSTLLRESIKKTFARREYPPPSSWPPFYAAIFRILLAATTTIMVTSVSSVGVEAAAAVYGAQSFAAAAQMTIAASYTGKLAGATSEVASRSNVSSNSAMQTKTKAFARKMQALYVWAASDVLIRVACAITAACLYAVPESGTMRPAFIPLTFLSAFNAFWMWWYFSRTFGVPVKARHPKEHPQNPEALAVVASP